MRKRLTALLLAASLLLATACARSDVPAGGEVEDPVSGGVEPTPPPVEDPVEPTPPPVEDPVEPTPPPVEEPPAPEPPAPTVSTLAVCGDIMSHMPVTRDAWVEETGDYDYARIMSGAADYIAQADFAVGNLETTLAGGPNYSGYPNFNSPDGLAYSLQAVGFDLLLTANNHCMDKGFQGLCRTLDVLDEVGLPHVGTSRTQEEADDNFFLADVGGISVVFLGYTYGTNGIPLPKDAPFAVNLFNIDYMTSLSEPDYDKLETDLAAAEALEPDLVAVMIHWGVEYQTKQDRYQEEMADFLFSHGADMILGGHPHVLQPMELRTLEDGRQGFVCYSLGNFISSQNSEYTDTTVVLTLELTKDNITGETQVTGYEYMPMYMLDRESGAKPRFDLLDAYKELAAEDTDASRVKLEKAIADCHDILGTEHDALYVPEIPETGDGPEDTETGDVP